MQELQVHVLHLAVPNAGLQGHHGRWPVGVGADLQFLGRASQGLPGESANQQAEEAAEGSLRTGWPSEVKLLN